jgi:ferredoxin-NADP reductase
MFANIFQTFGIVLLGGAILVLFLMLAQYFRLVSLTGKTAEARLKLLDEKLQTLRGVREQQQSLPVAWNGIRKFRVDRKVPEPGGICSFYLVPNDGKVPLPSFHPGQFLTFRLDLDGKEIVRCYSLSDCHRPDHYRVSIKKVLPPREPAGLPPGKVSSHFHESVNVGDILDVRAPSGEFAINPHDSSGLVLSGAGVGVTPVLSMLNAIIEEKARREVWFFYGVRNGSENMLKEQIREWRAAAIPNVHIVVCYSDPASDDRLGEDFDYKGRVGADLFQKLLPSANFDFYTCGPPPMMNGVREGLAEWGVPESRVHDEAFMQVTKAVKVSASVDFKRTGKKVGIDGEIANLVKFAESEGVKIPTACWLGKCGTCMTALVEGKVKYSTKPTFDKLEKGCCLPCICVPDGNIVLDA